MDESLETGKYFEYRADGINRFNLQHRTTMIGYIKRLSALLDIPENPEHSFPLIYDAGKFDSMKILTCLFLLSHLRYMLYLMTAVELHRALKHCHTALGESPMVIGDMLDQKGNPDDIIRTVEDAQLVVQRHSPASPGYRRIAPGLLVHQLKQGLQISAATLSAISSRISSSKARSSPP